MADWTTIPDTTFEPGAPAKGRDMRFLRDNPIAITEGAPGAPRIVRAAVGDSVLNPGTLPSVSAGASVRYIQDQVPSSTGTSPTVVASFYVLNPGSVRMSFDHRVTDSSTATGRITKNGSTIQSWSTSSTSFQSRSVDVSVSPGDVISLVSFAANPGSVVGNRNFAASTSGENLWPSVKGYSFA